MHWYPSSESEPEEWLIALMQNLSLQADVGQLTNILFHAYFETIMTELSNKWDLLKLILFWEIM